MNVAVLGLWHLGSVTAACLADVGHAVAAYDPNPDTVTDLDADRPPVNEPGLPAMIAGARAAGRLRFTTDLAVALKAAEVVFVTFDTPVDEEDRADVDYVVDQVTRAFPFLADDALIVSCSQLPVGTVRRLEQAWAAGPRAGRVAFACAPENLRLGKAIDVFMHPDRVVLGVRDERSRDQLSRVFAPITDRLEWMSVESAEMTKHAINGFLATSVAFINEVALLCEQVGADAREVARGLKTERRIGPHAYLSAGGAFAGGTLARDVSFLRGLGRRHHVATSLIDGVLASNTAHKAWAQQCLGRELADLAGQRIAVWGLTYKPGTSTLRRSSAIELCDWLARAGAEVHAHDPDAEEVPTTIKLIRHPDPLSAAAGAAALIVATEWPVYKAVPVASLAAAMPGRLVLDANQFLRDTVGTDIRFRWYSVGRRPS